MGIQINGSTDRITAIDGTIDFVSNIGNIGLITASNYVLQDAITIGAGSTIIKTVNGKLGIGSAIPSVKLDVEGGTKSTQYQLKKSGDSTSIGAFLQLTNQAGDSNSNDVTLTAAHSTNSIVLRAASKVTAWTYYNSAYRERVRINNDGRVWINSTTGASATELLRVENDASTSDDCRISIITGDAGESVVLFGNKKSNKQEKID